MTEHCWFFSLKQHFLYSFMFWACSPPGYLLFFQLKNFNYFYFWLHGVFVATHGLSLAVVSGGDSLVAVSGLVIEAVSLVAGHEKWAQASAVVAHELSCPLTYAISTHSYNHCNKKKVSKLVNWVVEISYIFWYLINYII